jgi:hypothetical protein
MIVAIEKDILGWDLLIYYQNPCFGIRYTDYIFTY